MVQFSIGADPEFFLRKDGQNVSAHGLVEGTKDVPHKLERGAVQIDGTALEFNIDPANTLDEFNKNLDTVLDQVRQLIPKEYEFVFNAVHEYDKDYFDTIPADNLILGCEPDYDAYTGEINNPPNPEVTFRTGAGHVHFGWRNDADVQDKSHLLDCRTVILMADSLIGYPLLLLEPKNKRNELYGKAGAFRPKPYGCEWRTASNFWLSDPDLRDFVFLQTQEIAKRLNSDKKDYYDYTWAKSFLDGNNYFPAYLTDPYDVEEAWWETEDYFYHYMNGEARKSYKRAFHRIIGG